MISTFAAFFPASAPKYVLVIDARRADERSSTRPSFRTAGLTAAPVLGARDPPAGAGHGHAPRGLARRRRAAALHARRKRIARWPKGAGRAGDHGRNGSDGQADGLRGAGAARPARGARATGRGRCPRSPASRWTAARRSRGISSPRCPAAGCTAAEFIPYALRMGAVAVLTDAEGLARAEAEARAARGAGDPERRAAARAGHRRRPLLRQPAGGDGRGDRHQRQDLGRELHPPDLGGPGRDGGELRHRRRRGRGGGAARRTPRPSRSRCTRCWPSSPTRA